jgi:hypothetical protein
MVSSQDSLSNGICAMALGKTSGTGGLLLLWVVEFSSIFRIDPEKAKHTLFKNNKSIEHYSQKRRSLYSSRCADGNPFLIHNFLQRLSPSLDFCKFYWRHPLFVSCPAWYCESALYADYFFFRIATSSECSIRVRVQPSFEAHLGHNHPLRDPNVVTHAAFLASFWEGFHCAFSFLKQDANTYVFPLFNHTFSSNPFASMIYCVSAVWPPNSWQDNCWDQWELDILGNAPTLELCVPSHGTHPSNFDSRLNHVGT